MKTKGFSLIEVLIAASLMMLTGLAFSSMIVYMNKEIRYARQKVEALEFRQVVAKTLTDLATCSCQLRDNSTPFDSNDPASRASTSAIRANCGSSAPLVAQSNAAVPGSNTQLKFGQIEMADIQSLGTADKYRGKLRVPFFSDEGPALAGVDIDVHFTTSGSASAKAIQACDFVSAAGVGSSSITGSCPPNNFVSGIVNGAVACSPLPTPPPTPTPGPTATPAPTATPTSAPPPGKGCTGLKCKTSDYGPCNGNYCITNGDSCVGLECTACGPKATCKGNYCCTGPACSGCSGVGVTSKQLTGSISDPGAGCTGLQCKASDYGSCNGNYCITNGDSCVGLQCTACGLNAKCEGNDCCHGPLCAKCSYYNQFTK